MPPDGEWRLFAVAAEITVESDMDDDGKRSGIVFPSMNKVYREGARMSVGSTGDRSPHLRFPQDDEKG
jgi:hypothetical protein